MSFIQPQPLTYKVPTFIDDVYFGCTFQFSHTGPTQNDDYYYCKWTKEIQQAYKCTTIVAVYKKYSDK